MNRRLEHRERAIAKGIERARAALRNASNALEQAEAAALLNALLTRREDVWEEKYRKPAQPEGGR